MRRITLTLEIFQFTAVIVKNYASGTNKETSLVPSFVDSIDDLFKKKESLSYLIETRTRGLSFLITKLLQMLLNYWTVARFLTRTQWHTLWRAIIANECVPLRKMEWKNVGEMREAKIKEITLSEQKETIRKHRNVMRRESFQIFGSFVFREKPRAFALLGGTWRWNG